MKPVGIIYLICILIFERLYEIFAIELKSDFKNFAALYRQTELNDIPSNNHKIKRLNKTYAMIDLKNNEIVSDLESLTNLIYEIEEVKIFFIDNKD